MKKTIKTEKVLEAFNILQGAKSTNLSTEERIKVWKISRILAPIAERMDADGKDAAEKFKEGFENFDERLAKAQEYMAKSKDKNVDAKTLPMGAAEFEEFKEGDWKAYSLILKKALDEFAQKEIEVMFEPISENTLIKLMESNDWTFEYLNILDFLTK